MFIFNEPCGGIDNKKQGRKIKGRLVNSIRGRDIDSKIRIVIQWRILQQQT